MGIMVRAETSAKPRGSLTSVRSAGSKTNGSGCGFRLMYRFKLLLKTEVDV